MYCCSAVVDDPAGAFPCCPPDCGACWADWNCSFVVPASAPSIVSFQMSDGSPAPYTAPPPLVSMGLLSAVPTQTAVDSDGVNPTIHASLFEPVSPNCAVPVLAADARPPARPWFREYAAIGTIAWVTVSAMGGSIRCSPSDGGRSSSTWPSASTTFCTKYGSWNRPDAASVAYADAMSIGRV
ncbi:hypothetical protein RHDE110596_23520 [Prescottella defluvii]